MADLETTHAISAASADAAHRQKMSEVEQGYEEKIAALQAKISGLSKDLEADYGEQIAALQKKIAALTAATLTRALSVGLGIGAGRGCGRGQAAAGRQQPDGGGADRQQEGARESAQGQGR
eukprot:3309649-Rhodomonas_salina.5